MNKYALFLCVMFLAVCAGYARAQDIYAGENAQDTQRQGGIEVEILGQGGDSVERGQSDDDEDDDGDDEEEKRCFRARDYACVVECLQKSIASGATHDDDYFDLAAMYYYLKNYKESLFWLQKTESSLSGEEDEYSSRLGLITAVRSLVYHAMGEHRLAADEIARAISNFEEDTDSVGLLLTEILAEKIAERD